MFPRHRINFELSGGMHIGMAGNHREDAEKSCVHSAALVSYNDRCLMKQRIVIWGFIVWNSNFLIF